MNAIPVKMIDDMASADRLLIVAAAGLSISNNLPNNPYHNNKDFEHHYPFMKKYGYHNCYETMGLSRDPNVPNHIKTALIASHFLNMRSRFPPTPAYQWLRSFAESEFQEEDVFCWTSNVDGCFERSDFPAERVYATQGDMQNYQCNKCQNVWNCTEQLHALDEAKLWNKTDHNFVVPENLKISCTNCGAKDNDVIFNLRGGNWFIHKPYESVQERLLSWMDESVRLKKNVCILEVGVGRNTPIVTRIPACAFASAVVANGGKSTYVRINPDSPEPRSENPIDSVHFYRLRESWSVLENILLQVQIKREKIQKKDEVESKGEDEIKNTDDDVDNDGESLVAACKSKYTEILYSLRTPR